MELLKIVAFLIIRRINFIIKHEDFKEIFFFIMEMVWVGYNFKNRNFKFKLAF